jgi:hypothetical protein
MKKLRMRLFILVLMEFIFMNISMAAGISSDLQKVIDKAKGSDKKIPIILVVKTPAVSLSDDHHPKERSELILKKQQIARESQSGVLKFLADKKNIVKVDSIRSFWINNSISMNATADLILGLAKRTDVEEITTEKTVEIQQKKIEKKIEEDRSKIKKDNAQ